MTATGRRRALLAAAVAAGCLLTSLGAALALDPGAGGEVDRAPVTITMTDDAIGLEPGHLAAGQHTFRVLNEGTTEHEIVVLRTRRGADELPFGLHGVSIKLAGKLVVGEDHLAARHSHKPGQVLGLLPGESRDFTARLAPGNYVAYCQTDGHYLAGERTGFTVSGE